MVTEEKARLFRYGWSENMKIRTECKTQSGRIIPGRCVWGLGVTMSDDLVFGGHIQGNTKSGVEGLILIYF